MSAIHPFIAEHVAEAMQQLGNISEDLTEAMIEAGTHLADRLVNERKIAVAGIDSFAPLAELFCQKLVHSDPDLRPALPALCLNNNSGAVTERDASYQLIRPLQAFTQSGDVLLLLCEESASPLVVKTCEAASAKNISTVIISPMPPPRNHQSIYLPLAPANLTRMHEMTLFILNALSAMINEQLFGRY